MSREADSMELGQDTYARGAYARLVLRGDDGKRITRYVKVARESADGLCIGERVTKDGNRWERETSTAVQVGVVAWMASDVIKRTDLRLSMRYATLVEVSA
jgi:hypothetical protein